MSTQPTRKLPYKQRLPRAERKQLIEQAAEAMFAERGYAGTSLEDVAAAAGISRPVIYDYYPTKRELYEELGARHVRAMIAYMASRAAEAEPRPEALLVAAASAFYEFMEKNPYAWRITVDALSHTGGVTDPEVHSELSDGIAALLTRAFELSGKGVAPERVTRYAETMRWAIPGLAAWWWHHRDVSRLEIVDTIYDLLWTGLEQMTETDSR